MAPDQKTQLIEALQGVEWVCISKLRNYEFFESDVNFYELFANEKVCVVRIVSVVVSASAYKQNKQHYVNGL